MWTHVFLEHYLEVAAQKLLLLSQVPTAIWNLTDCNPLMRQSLMIPSVECLRASGRFSLPGGVVILREVEMLDGALMNPSETETLSARLLSARWCGPSTWSGDSCRPARSRAGFVSLELSCTRSC